MGKQVCDIHRAKGMSRGQSNEHLRVGADGAYEHRTSWHYDPTREHLDFEVTKGGKIVPLDKSRSIDVRIGKNLQGRGLEHYNVGEKKKGHNTVVNIILGGSTDTMRKLAFGNQEVNWERGADNSAIERMPEIEKWAQDMYNFFGRKYGYTNIAACVCHLDETNPHIHLTLLPIVAKEKTYKDGHTATKQRFSYNELFGAPKYGSKPNKLTLLHDELAEVNKKWGLERGDPVALTGAQHKSMHQYLMEKNEELTRTNTHLTSVNASVREETDTLRMERKKAKKRLKGLRTMLLNLEREKMLAEMNLEKLDEQLSKGKIDLDTYEQQKVAMRNDIFMLSVEINKRKRQIDEAQIEYDKVRWKKEDLEEEVSNLENIKKNEYLPLLKKHKILQIVNDLGIIEKISQINPEKKLKIAGFREKLVEASPEWGEYFDRVVVGDDIIGDLLKGQFNEVMDVATNLFLGYVDAATDIAVSHGGSGPGTGWGRDPYEDDDQWWKRCQSAARKMLKPAQREQQQRRSWHR